MPTSPTIYKQYRLESWDEFLKIISGSPYSNWAFRGHRKEAWPLASTLSRYFRNFRIDPRAWPQQEGRILRVFKRKAHQFLTQLPHPDDDFEWLALMQHHGAPTRLLDFTWSPYVAAFFALEHATGDAAVWALNPADINPPRIRLSTKSRKPAITKSGMDPRRKGNFARYFLKGDLKFIWLDEPETMNRRLIAQAGTFAVPGVLDKPMEEIVQRYPDPRNMIAKFILPAGKLRETGLRDLYRMQITNATLFPDLDGLARSLAYELEIHWAYNPRTMESIRTEE
jgi:hypothetical protein